MNDVEKLGVAHAVHDDEPQRAAGLLREIDPAALAPGDWPRLSFLHSHVLGEKLGDWGEAWSRQQGLLAAAGDEPGLAVLRHAAVAARLGGDPAQAADMLDRLAGQARVPADQAGELIDLAVGGITVAGLQGREAGEAALRALAPLRGSPAWTAASGLDTAAAVLTNNLASDLLDRAPDQLQAPALRDALVVAAQLSQGFWQRAGQWVHHERAHYLQALAGNALGDAAGAELHARAGLALLAEHDTEGHETVDHAFLALELSHALARQNRGAESAQARAEADALAASFGDDGLTTWFNERVARNALLLDGPPG